MNNQPKQVVVTFCYPQLRNGDYNFSGGLHTRICKLNSSGYIIKQISTTSFNENGRIVIAYTLLMEKCNEDVESQVEAED